MDFRNLKEKDLKDIDFIYADPPYLITDAVYNENSGWGEEEEKALLGLLDNVNNKGIKFALSNLLQKKKLNIKNEILFNWLEENKEKYFVHNIEYHYRSASYNKKNRNGEEQEVLITNYKTEE